jgi:hypothetical protein
MPNHFTDEIWSDYARGLAPPLQATAVEQHLQKGCETCHKSLRFWRTLAQTARSETHNELPDDLVKAGQAAYVAWSRRYLLPRRARMARLIFDSLFEPLPVGVRSDSPLPRRVLERSGQWLFDLRFEPAGSKRVILMGQILRSGKQSGGRFGLPVLLMRSDVLVTETWTNQFGEFELQFNQATGLRIYFDIPSQRPIGLLLPDLDKHPADEDTATD